MSVAERWARSQVRVPTAARYSVTSSHAPCEEAWAQRCTGGWRICQASRYPAQTRIVARMAKAKSNFVPGHVAGLKTLIRPALSKVRHRMLPAARGRNGPQRSAHPVEHRVDRAVAFSDVERVLDCAADE